MFGYGFAVSDIRVTLANGSEVDCVQKIYSVGRFLAAGFAGSVRIGFAMIHELRRRSAFENERFVCDPMKLAEEWPSFARLVYVSSRQTSALSHAI